MIPLHNVTTQNYTQLSGTDKTPVMSQRSGVFTKHKNSRYNSASRNHVETLGPKTTSRSEKKVPLSTLFAKRIQMKKEERRR